MKKALSLILALALVLCMMTCAFAEEKKDYSSVNIAVFCKAFIGDFWQSVQAGCEAAAKDYGVNVTVDGMSSETDLEGQVKLIENAIIKGVDVIALAPIDSVGNVPVVETAIEKGIKVITFNSKLDPSDIALTHVATDNRAAGELAGKTLGELMGGTGKYAVIGAVESVKNNRDRSEGCIEYITNNYPDMELVSSQYCEGDMQKALAIATDLITANPDLKGFFTNNETTTIALGTVLAEKGKIGEITHVGFDATTQTADFLRNGTTGAIVSQVPYNMGYIAIEKALAAYDGEELEPTYDTGVALATPENVDSDEIQAIINPTGK